MNRHTQFARVFVTSAILALAAGTLSACSGFGNYEPSDREHDLSKLPDPNQPNLQRVYTTALEYVISRYRQGGEQQPIAINLPPGTRQSNYLAVASQVGRNVEPLTQAIANTNSMPIYHVGAIQLRGNGADVDIYRPTTEIEPDPKTGKPVYQVIRVKLEGGLKPWRALIGRSYEPGMLEAPQYYVLPPTDDPFQFENWKKEQRDLAFAQERTGLEERIQKLPTGDNTSESKTQADGQPPVAETPQ